MFHADLLRPMDGKKKITKQLHSWKFYVSVEAHGLIKAILICFNNEQFYTMLYY